MQLPDWGRDWLASDAAWKFAVGGRGSAKTHTLVRLALLIGATRRIRVHALRDTLAALSTSVRQVVLEVLMQEPELDGFYAVLSDRVTARNGTEWRFGGLSTKYGTSRGIRGAEAVDIFLVDEGQYVSRDAFQDLAPTIRKEGAEVWVALNPRRKDDVLYEMSGSRGVHTVEVNWDRNPFWTSLQEMERQRYLEMYPWAYDHVYEGRLADGTGALFPTLPVTDVVPGDPPIGSARCWLLHEQPIASVRLDRGPDPDRFTVVDAQAFATGPAATIAAARAAAAGDGDGATQLFVSPGSRSWGRRLVEAVDPHSALQVELEDDDLAVWGVAASDLCLLEGDWNAQFSQQAERFPTAGEPGSLILAAAAAFNWIADAPVAGNREVMEALRVS